MNGRDRGDRILRDLLRRGDPAADGREPDARQLAAMRAALLAEPEARRPLPRLLPLAAAAGLAVLLAVGWLLLRPAPPPAPDGPVIAGPVTGLEPTEPAAPPAGEETASPLRPSPGPSPPATSPAAPVVVAAAVPVPERPDRPARQVQLRGPGGTKILWKLDPDFKL